MSESWKVNGLQNLLGSFCEHFPADEDEMWCGDEAVQMKYSDVSFSEIYWRKEMPAVSLAVLKITPETNKQENVGMHMVVH